MPKITPFLWFNGQAEAAARFHAANPKTQAQFADELNGFGVSQGTIRFTVAKPLPPTLVKKLAGSQAASADGSADAGVGKVTE